MAMCCLLPSFLSAQVLSVEQTPACPPLCVPFTASKIKSSPEEVPEPVFQLLSLTDNKGFAARINNQVFFSLATPKTDYYAASGGINPKELTLFASINTTDRITIFLNSATAVGSYDLGGTTLNTATYTTLIDSNLLNYSTDLTRKGSVQITTYDVANGFVSGFFNFQAVSKTGEIEIKEGEFANVPFR